MTVTNIYLSDESMAVVQNEEVPWTGRHLLNWCQVLRDAATYREVEHPNAVPVQIEDVYLKELVRQASHLRENKRTSTLLQHVMHAIKAGSTQATLVHVPTDEERLENLLSREPKLPYEVQKQLRIEAARIAEAELVAARARAQGFDEEE